MTRPLRIVTAALCGLPAVLLSILTVAYTVELPFWDEWLLLFSVDRIERTGDVAFLLTSRYGDHHKPVTELLLCAVAPWTGASVRARTLLSVTTAVLALVSVLSVIGAGRWGAGARAAASICAAWILLSPAQYRNWTWGVQLCVYLSLSTACLGWRALLLEKGAVKRAALAVFWGVLSSFSFGAGMLYWPASLYLCWRRKDRTSAAALVPAALAAGVLYRIPSGPQLSAISLPGADTIGHVLRFLGAALGAEAGSIAAALGLLYLGYELTRRRDTEATADLFGTAGLYALLCGLAVSVYRPAVPEEVPERYMTYSCLYWMSVSALLIRRIGGLSGALQAAALGLLLCALILLARSGWRGALAMEERSVRQTELRRMVLADEMDPELARREVNPDIDVLDRCLSIAHRRGYSPYPL